MFPRNHLTWRTLPVTLATAVGLLLLGFGVTVTAVAVQQPPSLDLEPDSGSPGSGVTATARGFTGCSPSGDDVGSGEVVFAWDGVEVLDVVTIENGAASTRFLVPEGATLGEHDVVARCGSDDSQSASADFTVIPVEVPPVIVPNIVGLSANAATDTLQAADLVLGTVTGNGDRIDSQDPEAGTEAARGTPVDVTLAPAPPVLVTVPDLDGMTPSGARAALESVGLLLGSVSGDGDVVGAQSPRAGVEVPRGSTVAVIVVPVTPALVVVPDLVGSDPAEVPRVLAERGLVLGQQSGDGDVVRSQNPEPGSRVPLGSAVSVSLERGTQPPRLVRVPQLQGMALDEARAVLEPLGLVLANSPRGDRVASQEPAAGTMVPRRTSITLTMTAAETPWWPGMAAALAVLAGAALTSARLLRPRLDRRWLRRHVHLAPGGYAPPDLDVSESTAEGAEPTVAIRLEPHADSGTHVLEEVGR